MKPDFNNLSIFQSLKLRILREKSLQYLWNYFFPRNFGLLWIKGVTIIDPTCINIGRLERIQST